MTITAAYIDHLRLNCEGIDSCSSLNATIYDSNNLRIKHDGQSASYKFLNSSVDFVCGKRVQGLLSLESEACSTLEVDATGADFFNMTLLDGNVAEGAVISCPG